MKKNIWQLLIARALAECGSNMYSIVLPLLVLSMSGSLAEVGIFYSLVKIPSILLLPFLGVFVEKISRKHLIMGCTIFLLLIFIGQLILFLTHQMNVNSLIMLGILINIVASVNDIATRVIFSELVPADQLEKYNGVKSVIDNGSIFIAPMVGTFLYGILGIESVLALMIIFYGLAASGIFFLKYSVKIEQKKESLRVFGEMKEGLRFIKSQKMILAFFILATTLNFFVASTEEVINPGILIVKNSHFDFQKWLPKFFVISSSIMIAIGTFSILFQGNYRYIFYGIFLFLQVLLGFFTMLINVPLTAYFQKNVPVNVQGRFFALFSFTANLSIPFGIANAGFFAEKIGADITYIINNLLVILIVLVTYHSVDILGKNTDKR